MSSNFLRTVVQTCLIFFVSFTLLHCSEDPIEPETAPDVRVSNPDDLQLDATASALACASCDYVVPANKTTIDGKVIGIKPGDVICLNATTSYPYLTFTNLQGTEADPIVITNCDGEVTINAPGKPYVIKVANSKHFRVSGGNVNGGYGIKLTGATTNGLVLGPFASHFKVDHIEAFKVGFSGIMAKTDPTCDVATHRGNFIMRDVTFNHNYIHDTGGEGFYIGHTGYNGTKTPCGTKLPHTIENVRVYKNLVRNSGWDGIQLSSATSSAYIFGNIIENYSTKNKPDQSGGICIGTGTVGECHSNIIKKGNGPGITVFGLSDNVVHNNIIVDAGSIGIFCDDRSPNVGDGYFFLNNTIINPKTEGIRLYSDKAPVNVFANNIVVNPGTLATLGEKAYIFVLNTGVKVKSENNYLTRDIKQAKFVNPVESDYRISTASSPVVNKGRDISAFNITHDYYGTARLSGGIYDIGAAEFQQ